MTIEFFTPHGEVPEHIIVYVKEKMMEFYHRDHEIHSAEVVFRHQHIDPGQDHVCEVTLNIYGEMLMVHRSAVNYLEAVKDVVNELSLKVDEFLQRQKEPPDQITSTVKA